MPWTNYHSHTHYCDGTDHPSLYFEKINELGLLAYGYSTHAPVDHDEVKWCMKGGDLQNYIEEVNALKGKGDVQIYLGLEVDYIPGKMGPNDARMRAANLDYTVGSVHFVDAFANGRPWEIDGPHSWFLEGLEKIFDNDAIAVAKRYFELSRQMIREDCPDIVGHLDKIKMQNIDGKFFSESNAWYQQEVLQMLEEIAATEAIIEVNTRGIYKKKTAEPYPGRWALEKILDLGIPVMINSDSHHPSEILKEYETAARLLLDVGFTHQTVLLDGEWQPVAFSEQGLDWPG